MSAKDDWTNPNDAPLPAKKKKMSGCMFASLILGGLGVVGLVVCCGGVVALGYMFQPTVSKVPDEVAAAGKQILNITVPPEFTGEESISMDNFVFTMRIAQYRHKEGKGNLMMGAFRVKLGDPNQAKMQQGQFREPLQQQHFGQIVVKKSDSIEVTIDGQKVSVTISEGTNQQTQKEVHMVSFDFVHGSDPTFFVMSLDDDVWDQDAVIQMLEGGKAE